MNISQSFRVHYRLFKHLFGIRKCVFTTLEGRRETSFFENGWGDEAQLTALSNAELVNAPAATIEIEWGAEVVDAGGFRRRSGTFVSTLPVPLINEEARVAHVEWHQPSNATLETPLCVVFAMTGDEGFEYRYKTLTKNLLRQGIATLLLENSYYGLRKPARQYDYRLPTVQDMLSMSVASVQEGKALLKYFRDRGHLKLGVAGVSQGGMVASLVGALSEFPVAIASSLAAHTPDEVLVRGLLSCFVDWAALSKDPAVDPATRLKKLFELGDITLLPAPRAPSAAFLLGAKRDVVIPRDSLAQISGHWKGSQVRWIAGTHVTSIFLHSRSFRRLIVDSFAALNATTD